jgi:hypothetical protein
VTPLDVTSLDEGVTSPTMCTRTGCESASIELVCCSFGEDRLPSFGYTDRTERIVAFLSFHLALLTRRNGSGLRRGSTKRNVATSKCRGCSNNPLFMPHTARLRVYGGYCRVEETNEKDGQCMIML